MVGSRGGRRRRWAMGSVVVAVPVALAGAVMIGGSSGPAYRTASVERADLDATLDSVGTIQPINQANLSFPVAGTVHSVSTALGQHVTVGQTLAQLDTTSLDAQVASAQAAVAAAWARLSADQSSQTVTAAVTPTAFSTQIPSGVSAPSLGTSTPDPSAARDLVTRQQVLIIADQHRADQDIAQEKRDLTTENSLCQAFVTSAQNDTQAPSSQRSQHAVATTQQQKTYPTSDASPCASAIATVLADQTAVEGDQHALSTDLPALSTAIDKLMATTRDSKTRDINQLPPLRTPQPSPTPQPLPTPRPAQTSKTPQTPKGQQIPQPPQPRTTAASAAGGTNRTASVPRPASAEQLASDQAAIDAAQAQLTEAQQARNQAELRSPIDGAVGSMTISAGQSVEGSSGTPQIVVIGPGTHQVMTSVTDANVGSLQVGETATIIPSGGGAPLAGQVVSISLLASPGSAGSVSYPVTIGLTGSDAQLFPGQSASVSITLAHVSDTLTVPTSAVHHLGTDNVVSVLRNGTPSNIIVTLGATGPTRTQVITGLNLGDQVILADLSRPLPTAGAQNIRRITGGSGGRPGG